MNTLNINSIHTCTQHKIMHYITNDHTHIITHSDNSGILFMIHTLYM